MKRGWKRSLIGGVLAFIMCCRISLAAEEPGKVLSFGTEDKNIILYVQNPGEEYEIQCQIGTSEAEAIESHRITEDMTSMETIILLDNSLSVVEKYRPTINTILSQLAENRMDGELFTVATFSDQLNYLIKDCTDYTQIKQVIDGVSYNNQETYLTDILYDMLTEINVEDNITLKRIVIISDGVDNKSIGYTKEELYDLLKKRPYPIYTIGCTYQNNNEQLKNMFALSRMTGGESYLLDEVSDPMVVVNGVKSLNDAIKVVITPKAKDCDGTKKGVGLTVTANGQTVTNTLEITMPFSIIEETTQEETTPEETTQKETQTETTPEPTEPMVEQPEQKEFPLIGFLIGGGVVLAALIGGAVVYILRKKEKENKFISATASETGNQRETVLREEQHQTQIMGNSGQNSERREGTVLLWENNTPHRLILTDINNPVKKFEVSLNSPVLVGYNNNCQICLNYEETISGNHCRIYGENGKFYVENLSKTNGTFLDGKQVVNTAEIYTGCVMTLGRLKMKVEIR